MPLISMASCVRRWWAGGVARATLRRSPPDSSGSAMASHGQSMTKKKIVRSLRIDDDRPPRPPAPTMGDPRRGHQDPECRVRKRDPLVVGIVPASRAIRGSRLEVRPLLPGFRPASGRLAIICFAFHRSGFGPRRSSLNEPSSADWSLLRPSALPHLERAPLQTARPRFKSECRLHLVMREIVRRGSRSADSGLT
jgi:hypothetical protein